MNLKKGNKTIMNSYSGGWGVMVSWVISSEVKSKLALFQRPLKADGYLKLLQDYLVPFW